MVGDGAAAANEDVSRDRARFIFQVNIKEFKVLDKLQDPSINGS